MKNSDLVFISGVNENDPLQLDASSAKVMLLVRAFESSESKAQRLLKLVSDIVSSHINLQSITSYAALPDICRLKNFPHLKCISFQTNLSVKNVKDLTESILHWPEPELKTLICPLPTVNDDDALLATRSLIRVLKRCKQLQELSPIMGGPLTGSMPILMEDPPPPLRKLCLGDTMLLDEDVRSIAEAVKHHKLQQLEALMIHTNSAVTEAAVTELVKACVAVRPGKPLEIVVDKISTHIESLCKYTKITVKEHQSTSDD